MELQDNVLKTFADALNDTNEGGQESFTVYGTVGRKEGTTIFVRLNGADEGTETPATTIVEVGTGDVVMVNMRNHMATIIGNVTYPSLTRVGNVYITLTAEGLVVGQLNENNVPIGYHMLITSNDIKLLTLTGKVLASFGSTVNLGASDSIHSILNSDGLQVYGAVPSNGQSPVLLAKFGTTSQIGPDNSTHTVISSGGMTIYNSSGVAIVKIGVSAASDAYATNVNGLYVKGAMYAEGGPITVGNTSAEAMLAMWATTNGSVGLYANNREWLIRKNNSTGKIYLETIDIDTIVRAESAQLWHGTLIFNPNVPQQYTSVQVNSLTDWNVVLLRVRCGGIYTSVVIARSVGNADYYLSDPSYTYSGTTYVVKAAYNIDWSLTNVGVRRVAGPDVSGAYEIYAVMAVHGLVPAAKTRSGGIVH